MLIPYAKLLFIFKLQRGAHVRALWFAYGQLRYYYLCLSVVRYY